MKILMLSYPFPPYGGMSQRNVYFANHLVAKGYGVDVLAVNPSRHFHGYDADMVKLISPAVRVYRIYAGLVHHLICKYKGLRGVISPLMATFEWLPYGLICGYNLCRKNQYDVVYCHGDPFISHLLAYILKKRFGIPWITYIGDPRYFGAYSKFKFILKSLEPKCLGYADKIIVNCQETLDGYLQHFPFLEKERFTIITDGFDRARYETIPAELSDKFRIVYTGIFYQRWREPFELFKALEQLNNRKIELVIAGTVSDNYINFVKDRGLDGKVVFLGHQPHRRIVSLQKGASLLLALGWAEGYQIPGKIFEYIASRRPIMVIKKDDNDVASRLIEKHKRGVTIENSAARIAEVIQKLYELWEQGRLKSSFDLSELEEFEWSKLTDQLDRAMLDVVGNYQRGS